MVAAPWRFRKLRNARHNDLCEALIYPSAGLQPNIIDGKAGFIAVRFTINAANKLISQQHRQSEVSILPFRLRYVTLYLILKIKQPLQLVSIDDDVVKRERICRRLLPSRFGSSSTWACLA